MATYRTYTQTVQISDDDITIVSNIGSNILTAVIARDGSEDTNFAAAEVLHKNTALSVASVVTSPPSRVALQGRWVAQAASANISTLDATAVVPASSGGIWLVEYDLGITVKFQKNGGTLTTITSGSTITVADGDLLKFRAEGLPEQVVLNGVVTDTETEVVVDYISIYNTTPEP